MSYTQRQLSKWEAAKKFAAKVNNILENNPDYILVWDGEPVTRTRRIEVIDYDVPGHLDKWLAFKDGISSTHGIFSLNGHINDSIKTILSVLKNKVKIFKEVKVKL